MCWVFHIHPERAVDTIFFHQAAHVKTEEERQEFKKDLFSIQTEVKIEKDFWFEI